MNVALTEDQRLKPIPPETLSSRKGKDFWVGVDHPRQVYLGWKDGMTLYLDVEECQALRAWLNRALP